MAVLSVYFQVPNFLYERGKKEPSVTKTGSYQKAFSSYEKGKLEEALEELERVVANNPKDFEAQYLLGQTYESLGDIDKAVDAYEKAVELKPDDSRALYNLAIVYKAKGKKNWAIATMKKAVRNDKSFVGARFMLAKMYFDEGEFDEAELHYEKIVDINPYGFDMATVHTELGLVYLENDKKEQAITEWQNALEIDPDNDQAKELLEEHSE